MSHAATYAILGLLLAAGDVLSTHAALQRPGVVELNPITLTLWYHIGFHAAAALKIVTTAAIFYFYGWLYEETHLNFVKYAAVLVAFFTLAAIAVNLILAFA